MKIYISYQITVSYLISLAIAIQQQPYLKKKKKDIPPCQFQSNTTGTRHLDINRACMPYICWDCLGNNCVTTRIATVAVYCYW